MQFQPLKTPFMSRLEGKGPNIVSYLPAIENVCGTTLEVPQTSAKDGGKLEQIIAMAVGDNAFMLLYQSLQ